MQWEREVLAKKVFPKIRKLCALRQVVFKEVDFRWGITDEQVAEGKLLPICFEAIDRCRPFFIGLLGEYYGWIPDTLPDSLLKKDPWLAEHYGRSITELEMRYGVLHKPHDSECALFYFRDPMFLESLTEEARREFSGGPTLQEIAELGEIEAYNTASARKEKLRALKDEILKSGLKVYKSYEDAEQLGDLVLQDLTDIIDRRFPKDDSLDPLDLETAEHEAFIHSLGGVYIRQQKYFDRLDQHITNDDAPLVIVGDSGMGKTALLANWALYYRKQHPTSFVIPHFIGASSYSSDWASMVRRFIGEIQKRLAIQPLRNIPNNAAALIDCFAQYLAMIASRERMVLIIDALDQLEDHNGAPDLTWLPKKIPSNIRIICSTLPGRPLKEIQKRDWPLCDLEPLDLADRRQLIYEYLAPKDLPSPTLNRIAQAQQTKNTLYLRALLEELRLYGDHFSLNKRIDHYLTASTATDLYQLILERLEEDYNDIHRDLVQNTMALLWTARWGLSESELLDLLKNLDSDDRRVTQIQWSYFYSAIEHLLVVHSGLVGFFHWHIRQAVVQRYLPSPQSRIAAHLCLADYFAQQEVNYRKEDELPWHLTEAREWNRLYALLQDASFLEKLSKYNQADLARYWHQLEGNTGYRLTTAFQPIIREPSAYSTDVILALILVLDALGYPKNALSLRMHLGAIESSTRSEFSQIQVMDEQADLLIEQGDFDEAFRLCLAIQELLNRYPDERRLIQICLKMAKIQEAYGNVEDAIEHLSQAENISQKTGDIANRVRSTIARLQLLSKTHQSSLDEWELASECYFTALELGDAGLSWQSQQLLDRLLSDMLALWIQQNDFVGISSDQALEYCERWNSCFAGRAFDIFKIVAPFLFNDQFFSLAPPSVETERRIRDAIFWREFKEVVVVFEDCPNVYDWNKSFAWVLQAYFHNQLLVLLGYDTWTRLRLALNRIGPSQAFIDERVLDGLRRCGLDSTEGKRLKDSFWQGISTCIRLSIFYAIGFTIENDRRHNFQALLQLIASGNIPLAFDREDRLLLLCRNLSR